MLASKEVLVIFVYKEGGKMVNECIAEIPKQPYHMCLRGE